MSWHVLNPVGFARTAAAGQFFRKEECKKQKVFENNRPCDPTDDPQKSAFQSVSEDCQRERSQRTTLPVTLLTALKNNDFSMFLNRILARDAFRSSPGTSNLSPETPLCHCTGPKPDVHRFLDLILEVWGPSLGPILASLGHLWAPNAP